MKVLVDSNVVLDMLLNRSAFIVSSKAIFDFAEQKQITGFISASAITDIFYFVNKEFKDKEMVYQTIEKLTFLFSIIPVTETTIEKAFTLRWQDFEDAVQYTAAQENDIAYIITRNEADYKSSSLPCMSPSDFIVYTQNNEENP